METKLRVKRQVRRMLMRGGNQFDGLISNEREHL